MRTKLDKNKLIISITAGIFISLLVFGSVNGLNGKIQQQNKTISDMEKKLNEIKSNPNINLDKRVDNTFFVAKDTIKAGTKLSVEMVEPKKFDTPQPDGINNISDIIDKIILEDIPKETIVKKSKIMENTGESTLIGKGMRAISIPVNYIQGLASFMTIGTHIDVLSTGNGKDIKPQILVQNVKIISFETKQSRFKNNDENITDALAVTLEVPAKASAKLIDAMIENKLQFITRGLEDTKSTVNTREYPNLTELPSLPTNANNLTSLPEPAMPAVNTKKVELIQANVKTEVSFDRE
jgi:Flp pilus assembly protein CpaB